MEVTSTTSCHLTTFDIRKLQSFTSNTLLTVKRLIMKEHISWYSMAICSETMQITKSWHSKTVCIQVHLSISTATSSMSSSD